MNKIIGKIKVPVDSLKETSWSAIIGFSLIYCVYATFINLVVFKSNVLQPLYELTSGLIDQTLMLNIFSIIVFVFIIILKYGRLSFHDIGFKKNRVLGAAVAIIVVWISMQLINIIGGLVMSGNPVISNLWAKYGFTRVLGDFIGQLFGNCLFEEAAFRGFLLVQVCKKLGGTRGKFLAGVLLSQLLFALIHIPNRILNGMNIVEISLNIIVLVLIGVFFAVVYLITDNIFLAIGIHTLWNSPLLIFEGLPSNLVVFIAAIVLLIIWGKTFGRFCSRANSSSNHLNNGI